MSVFLYIENLARSMLMLASIALSQQWGVYEVDIPIVDL